MPITITRSRPSKYRPRAARFSNDDIRAVAPIIVALQAKQYVTSRDLAARLNGDGVPCASGQAWNSTLVFHILRRGRGMGLPFILLNRSDAASARRVLRRPKDVIAAERAAGLKALTQALATKTAIAAAADQGSARHGE